MSFGRPKKKTPPTRGVPSLESAVAPLQPGRERPTQGRLSPSLARIAERALVADEDDIRMFLPTEAHLRVSEAYIWGANSFKDVAEQTGIGAPTVGKICQDPVFCAWMWRNVSRALNQRLGQVLSVVFQRAIGGDMKAAQLILQHWGKKISRQVTLSATLPFDPTKLSDEELEKVIQTQTERTETRE